MNVNGLGALSAYTYQSTLSQTGSADLALSQALAASQSQVNDLSSLFASAGSEDPLAALIGTSGLSGMNALSYSTASSPGKGSEALQALLGSSAPTSSLSSLFSNSDGLSVSAAILAPETTAALMRYTYDQSQNHSASLSQALESGQQTLLASGLNLLA
ncbi:hypothetical protein [Geothrix sp. PMB-07]|uniref:hypothetical protein n=1 Tax=Geothrix sp. PMB-07 TaxID=3068640 RepID=UPI0027421C3D|nr:hypothetical protein [Geothrix sp. PMB-07]WLT31358.1 hypothetical protein Q9293_16725 [Geothrix sp. PMB-07]